MQEFLHQLTELLLTAAPQLTGGVIVELRGQLLELAPEERLGGVAGQGWPRYR